MSIGSGDPLEKRTSLEKVETLHNLLVSFATNRGGDDEEYRALRHELVSDHTIRSLLPRFVVTCTDLSQFWAFIKRQFSTYQDRRDFLWEAFAPLIKRLESLRASPADDAINNVLLGFGADHVHIVWERALQRLSEDPEGAITSARTLLESVCKHILDDTNTSYDDNCDLPKLYWLTAESLNIAPSQHTEKVFKQILGACQAVVDGLGSVRNRLGDAHGTGRRPVKPAPRHAELAVNLAGAMATFLVRTWDHQKETGDN